MKRRLAGLIAALALAACHSPAPEQAATPAPRPETEAACAKAGGDWTPVCRMAQPACVRTFADAGKACAGGSECGSGRCVAADETASPGVKTAGVCLPSDNPCGCFNLVENGASMGTLCAD
jgi:hypothetical protein